MSPIPSGVFVTGNRCGRFRLVVHNASLRSTIPVLGLLLLLLFNSFGVDFFSCNISQVRVSIVFLKPNCLIKSDVKTGG